MTDFVLSSRGQENIDLNEKLSLLGVTLVRFGLHDYFIGFLIVHQHVSINSDLSQALILLLICLKLWYSVCVVLLLGCHTPLPHVPGSSGGMIID